VSPGRSAGTGDELAQRYRAVLDTADVGILELDRRGRIVDANAAFLRMGGWASVAGRPASTLIGRADGAAHRILWDELVSGRRHRFESGTTLRRADGGGVSAHVVVTAVREAGGGTSAIVVVLAAPGPARPGAPGHPAEAPTAAEMAVLHGLAAGLTLTQVAGRLGLTRRGVDYRLARLRHKLRTPGVSGAGGKAPATTAGVVARAYALGLLEPGTWPPAAQAGAS
jgi:PAS domain S-box-containing protein